MDVLLDVAGEVDEYSMDLWEVHIQVMGLVLENRLHSSFAVEVGRRALLLLGQLKLCTRPGKACKQGALPRAHQACNVASAGRE